MSFGNLLFGNWFGQLSSSSGKTPELHPSQQDAAYAVQCCEPKPWLLIDTIFHVAYVVDRDDISKQVFKMLVKMDLLSAQGEINTEPTERSGFGKNIMSKLAFIPANQIKQIIVFLFWWAEETQRLKKLVAERDELDAIVLATPSATDERGVTAFAQLRRIKALITTSPGQRHDEEQISVGQHTADERPPAYSR